MDAPFTITEPADQLLKRLGETAELTPFELALYDRQFLLRAISAPQAALCGNPDNPFCNPACQARRAAKLASMERDEELRLIHCPGSLQHCLVPCRNASGERLYLLIGGGREPQANLSYLEELASLNRVPALPLLQRWSQLPQFKGADLLAAGRLAQSLLEAPSSPAGTIDNTAIALTEGLIDALERVDEVLAAATDFNAVDAAVSELLTPAFGPRAVTLLAPGERDPDFSCLDRWQAASANASDALAAAPAEQLTCLPLQADKELLGTLLCCGPCSLPRDIRLLNLLAARIAQRLQQLQGPGDTLRDQGLYADRFNRLLAATKPMDLCQRILDEAVALVPADKASLMLLNRTGNKLHLLASIGMNRAMAANLCVPADQGIAGQVLSSGQPLLVEDLEQDPRLNCAPRPRFASKSLLCLPLTAGNQHHGVICLTDRRCDGPFSEKDLDLLSRLVAPSALLIERLRNRERVHQLLDQAALDPATGVYSTRMFERRFSEEASRASRLRQPLALLLFAADRSEETGEQQIHELATRLKNTVRKMDVVGRLDDRLLAVLLPDTAREVALSIAPRLHGCDEEDEAATGPGFSCGIALYPGNGASLETLLKAAKGALDKARQQGGRQAALCDSSARNDKIVFL